MNAVPFHFSETHRTGRGRAFSMVELLVVIAIISVLAGILLVALKGVRERALATQTRATMQEFSKACDSFQIEQGRYPGVIPEGLLAANYKLSGTENAILDMMGGVVRGDHPEYDTSFLPADGWEEIVVNSDTPLGKIKVNLLLIGNGPEINGTPYSPYFTPKGDELAIVNGQVLPGGGPIIEPLHLLPDLVDAWGQPIIYVRRVRPVGPLVGDPPNDPPDALPPQFMIGPMRPYIDSDDLGEFGRNQVYNAITNPGGSILGGPNIVDPSATFAQIIRHPSFGESGDALNGTARGAYVLISAGKDGIYFSGQDGPGTELNPVENIVTGEFGNPQVVEEYDDIRLFGGG